MNWTVARAGKRAKGGVPAVSVARTAVGIAAIQFARDRGGRHDYHYLYKNGNTHPQLPGVGLAWWGRGPKITDPEWVAAEPDHRDDRACFTRKGPVSLSVKLVANTTAELRGTLKVTPRLDGSTAHVTEASAAFTYPAGAAEAWVDVALGGSLPDEVGRYVLFLAWHAEGANLRFAGPATTRHRIYATYGQPLDPGFDSAARADAGRPTSQADGTLTGTRKRLDHLMGLLGGSHRHPTATQAEMEHLIWRLHCGINDTPGAPPYFNAAHDEHLTDRSGNPLPVEDQWLAWLPTVPPHWNDASCIGHVQVAKTMLAAVGIFGRRAWVFPTTKRMPDGTAPAVRDEDCYCLGNHDASKPQVATLRDPAGRLYRANPKLLEPNDSWENFEACLLSPTGRFLPGGYGTATLPEAVRRAKGFGSAAELIRWWSNTSRPAFGKRFMAWTAVGADRRSHYWDVDGNHYDAAHVLRIRTTGKELPPP